MAANASSTATPSKIFVITGANRGIGLELTRQALKAGNQVIVGVRRANLSLELKDLQDQFSGKLKIVDLDVQTDASAKKFAESVGHDHVDVLVNNAGVYFKDDGKVSTVSPARVLETFNTNAVGALRVTQALLPLLKRSKSAKVANITSQMGSIADNSSGTALAYRMSKAAMNMFTKNLAQEEHAITVLSLHPGWVQTSMGGAGAPLAPTASAEGLLKVIENSSREASGKFFTYSGKELPW
jgi:NAD(P)-dependent dehydrogenase (short-subunit alcohol dehydrogenase family)